MLQEVFVGIPKTRCVVQLENIVNRMLLFQVQPPVNAKTFLLLVILVAQMANVAVLDA